jgi:hypothetical protein
MPMINHRNLFDSADASVWRSNVFGARRRSLAIGALALVMFTAGCGKPKVSPIPVPAQTQVSSPVQTSSSGGSAITSQINALSGQLNAVNGYLGQAQSGLSGKEGDPTK